MEDSGASRWSISWHVISIAKVTFAYQKRTVSNDSMKNCTHTALGEEKWGREGRRKIRVYKHIEALKE